jgi:hypothetical protein
MSLRKDNPGRVSSLQLRANRRHFTTAPMAPCLMRTFHLPSTPPAALLPNSGFDTNMGLFPLSGDALH